MRAILDTCGSENGLQLLFSRCAQALIRWGCLAVAFACIAVSGSYCQQSPPSEYQIKSVYLYNFTRFVEWPAEAPSSKDGPFAICVLGKDPFGPVLDATLSGGTVAGKSLIARRISRPQDALVCRILFVAGSEEGHLKEILALLDGSSVLTVSDISRFAERGGMIQFVLQKDKVRFEVNLTSAVEAGLVLGSDLLKVAAAVRTNPKRSN